MKRFESGVELAKTLREMADFYEQHPTATIPWDFMWGRMSAYMDDDKAKEVLRSIGSFRKEYDGEDFIAVKDFDGFQLRFRIKREKICKAVVIGKKTVEARVVPASFTPEKFIPAHEEDVVEWVCDESILAKPEEAPAQTTEQIENEPDGKAVPNGVSFEVRW
jgi:ribulose bisphosphate carboxylase small subunit